MNGKQGNLSTDLATALIGQTRLGPVLRRSLEHLDDALPGYRFAILCRVGPERYTAAAGHGVTPTDVRRLARRSCGDARLALGECNEGPPLATPPRYIAVGPSRRDDLSRPALVLGFWNVAGSPDVRTTSSLSAAARLIASATAAAATFENLFERATRDALTGLLNREAILGRLDREVDEAGGAGTPLALIYADLDGFKAVNDDHGHRAGDAMLVAVSQKLGVHLRAGDVLGRLGGDEFVAVLPRTDLVAARRIGRRLVRAIEDAPLAYRGLALGVGVSLGIAGLDEAPGAERLLDLADRRMLATKRRRRNAGASARRRSLAAQS